MQQLLGVASCIAYFSKWVKLQV